MFRLELRQSYLVFDDQHPHGGGALELTLGLEANEAANGLVEAFSQIEGAFALQGGLDIGEAVEDHVVTTQPGQVEVLAAPIHQFLHAD